jgi:hypothetical protein
MSAVSTIYKGSASFGRFMAKFWAIVITILSVFIVFSGINFIRSVSKYSKKSTGKVESKMCKSGICEYVISYIDENNKPITAKISSSMLIELNTQVEISYIPSDPTKIRFTSENTESSGYFLIFLGIFLTIGVWFWVWVTKKYEFAASASGISSAVDIFRK